MNKDVTRNTNINNKKFFRVIKKDKNSNARLGEITLKNGVVKTPVFMPVGTLASVKGLTPEFLDEVGASMILSNTYHLHLRPGEGVIKKMGGLHKFMNYSKPILTDSGGFQVFSLSKIRKITKEGVHFSSHISGEKLFMSPEDSISIQHKLGADIIMAFDECAPKNVDEKYVKNSVDLTLDWLNRCIKKNKQLLNIEKKMLIKNEGKKFPKNFSHQELFPIIQGGFYKNLREESAKRTIEALQKNNLKGVAIGGLSIGETKNEFIETLENVKDFIPESLPKYVMGIGTIDYILHAVSNGVDMFDCVIPTREARHGRVLTLSGGYNIKNNKNKTDNKSLDETCDCYTCRNFSKSYVRHLFTSNEPLSIVLLSIHNLRFMFRFMDEIKESINNDYFVNYKNKVLKNLKKS